LQDFFADAFVGSRDVENLRKALLAQSFFGERLLEF
jgi:hypothetical protein